MSSVSSAGTGFAFFVAGFVALIWFDFTCFLDDDDDVDSDGGILDFNNGLRLVDLSIVDSDAKLLSEKSDFSCLDPVHPIFLCIEWKQKKNWFTFTEINLKVEISLKQIRFIHLDFFFGVGWLFPSLSLLADDNAYVTAVRFRVERLFNNDILAQQKQQQFL